MSDNIYMPAGCQTLDKAKPAQIRLGIQGFPGSGKTWAALTFPNPIVANLDRGLGAHMGKSNIIEAPFYEEDFCKSVYKSYTSKSQIKDVCIMWLEKEAVKLTPEQTLIWDGGTSTQNAYHSWFRANAGSFLTKGGKIDDRAEWGEKIVYFVQLFEQLRMLRCNVVFISHEVEKKDNDGLYSGKIRPLLTGQSGDQMAGYFSDWFRQLSQDKPKDFDALDAKKLAYWGMDKATFKNMCDSFDGNTIYFWQTEGDDLFDAKRSSLVNCPRFIPAHYNSFLKYRRK